MSSISSSSSSSSDYSSSSDDDNQKQEEIQDQPVQTEAAAHKPLVEPHSKENDDDDDDTMPRKSDGNVDDDEDVHDDDSSFSKDGDEEEKGVLPPKSQAKFPPHSESESESEEKDKEETGLEEDADRPRRHVKRGLDVVEELEYVGNGKRIKEAYPFLTHFAPHHLPIAQVEPSALRVLDNKAKSLFARELHLLSAQLKFESKTWEMIRDALRSKK